jgi:hypothetical protein
MFRWMGPEAGRFLSADPVPGSMGDGQSWNRYAYALNDPVNLWDPEGLNPTPYRDAPYDVLSGGDDGNDGGGGAPSRCTDGDSYVCGYTDGAPIFCWCVNGVWVAFFDTVEGTAQGPAQPRGWQGHVWYVSMPGGGSRGGGGGGGGHSGSGSGCRSFFSFLNWARNTVGSLIGIDGTLILGVQTSATFAIYSGQIQGGVGISRNGEIFAIGSGGMGFGFGFSAGLGGFAHKNTCPVPLGS